MVEIDSDKLNNEEKSKKSLQPPKRIDNKIQAEKNEADDEAENADESPSRIKKGFERVCLKIGVNPNLFFLKITLFAMYGATACLIPYLTVHMQSIGLTVEDIGIIYLLLPLTTFLAPPITGKFINDKLIITSANRFRISCG